VGRLSAVVVSHLNLDHCSLLPYLSRRFAVGEVLIPAAGHLRPFGGRVRQWLRSSGLPVRTVSAGAEIAAGGLRCTVLHPDARFATLPGVPENEKAVVLRCACDGFRFVVPGDIEALAMRRLCLEHGQDLSAELLILPHHGHYHAGLAEFVRAVGPAVAVASGTECDCAPETRRLLAQASVPLWITGREGAVVVTRRGECVELRGHRSGRVARLTLPEPGGHPGGTRR
jgi:competence protein ComEC